MTTKKQLLELKRNPKFQRSVDLLRKKHEVEKRKVISFFFSVLRSLPTTNVVVDMNDPIVCILIWKIVEQKLELESVRKESVYDALTSIPNRRAFDEALDRLTKIVDRSLHHKSTHKKYLHLLLMDCDDFKEINDIYGHNIGDEVLKSVADTISSHTRSEDFCARYGGEEFALLVLSSEETKEVVALANRILKDIREIDLQQFGIDKNITISIGVSKYKKEDDKEQSKQSLIEEADKLLYKAKENGKDQVQVMV